MSHQLSDQEINQAIEEGLNPPSYIVETDRMPTIVRVMTLLQSRGMVKKVSDGKWEQTTLLNAFNPKVRRDIMIQSYKENYNP